jgi:hypothetical protein
VKCRDEPLKRRQAIKSVEKRNLERERIVPAILSIELGKTNNRLRGRDNRLRGRG